ncbi:MAG: hypothetical protein CMJ31_06455 [Phycisphaerae bacterium]|nr:hypothetical protein [Phycisphaerae bacterium]
MNRVTKRLISAGLSAGALLTLVGCATPTSTHTTASRYERDRVQTLPRLAAGDAVGMMVFAPDAPSGFDNGLGDYRFAAEPRNDTVIITRTTSVPLD